MNASSLRRILLLLSLSLSSVFRLTMADDAADDAVVDDGYQAADDDYYTDDGAAVADAAYDVDDNEGDGDYNVYYDEGKDYIQYWTDYAILPKRCVVYNDIDVVVFSLFENQYNQCGDKPVGTYYIPVATYIKGYMNQKAQDMEDQGYDYEEPEVAEYIYCTPYEVQGVYKYLQLGCADDSTMAMAVNIYDDKDCTTRSERDGYDDAAIDVSDIQPKFQKCKSCVNWFDRNDDAAADDQFYENRKKNAPLCSNAWTYKAECGRKCQHIGSSSSLGEGWSASDKVLLGILSSFGLIMLGLIVNKRKSMSNKNALLEKAALNAAGLQQPHVIGIIALVVVVIVVFVLLGLKNITWALLLLINTALFGYLMKLTVTTSVGPAEPMIGPDGEIILPADSDDSSVESESGGKTSHHNNGTYSLPTLS